MVRSMTGYGRAQAAVHGREITIEIRSVNHRYFDCSIRLPRVYSFLEESIKASLQKDISRGKVDVFLTIDSSGADCVTVSLNEAVVKGYLDVAKTLKEVYQLRDDLSVSSAMRLPDVLNVSKEDEDEDQLKEDIAVVLNEALKGYIDMSQREGDKLKEDIIYRISLIEDLVREIEVRSPKCVEEYRAKLEARMKEILESVTIDQQRILTEAAIFADKVAVTEEIVRLRSHLNQLRGMLEKGGAIGRKLDFLVQELNREANTIGSKANDVEMAQMVVDVKAEIEKIREQVQNIE